MNSNNNLNNPVVSFSERMKYGDFENIISAPRMERYLQAMANDTRKAIALYRNNLELSQVLFSVISCLEIALRNKIDRRFLILHGNDWLRDAETGMFSGHPCRTTKKIIREALTSLHPPYSHNKLIAKMDFGFWRSLFAAPQFLASRAVPLQAFPALPTSTGASYYDHTFVFNQLTLIDDLRDRITHHEPVCFQPGLPVKDTAYARQYHKLIKQLFDWMDIDESFLYGIDNVIAICKYIDAL